MVQNPFYVYALKDPRTNPLRPFYIGKGTGIRAWEHEINEDDTEKGRIIKAIHEAGDKVIHSIILDNLTEEQSLKVEAELISMFGILSQGGILANRVKPNINKISKKQTLNIPIGCYEKAQMGLDLIKASIVELAKANDGIKNADAAKYLGLQSDYKGGSKDYLSFSIIGILLREQTLQRQEDGKYISTKK